MGFGRRIGHTVRVPGRGLRRVVTILVVLMTAAATGGAVALSARLVARPITERLSPKVETA